jgi:ADP-heptose:LPS heptosyltransferase
MIQKALTFRASSIGDCLMGKYLLDNVHAQFPEARLAIVVASRSAMIRDLLAASAYIEVIEANRKNFTSLWNLWRTFRGSDFVVTQYAGKVGGKFSLASKLAARVLARRLPAQAGGLIGFRDVSRFNFLYDHLIEFDRSEAPAALERRALRAVGVPISLPQPTLSYVPNDHVLTKFNLQEKKYTIVHLFSSGKGRGLSPAKKRELLETLSLALPNVQIILTGIAKEKEELQVAAANLNARVIAGETSLQEMMNLMVHSAGVVAVDTGAAHIAAQLGVPLVVLSSCLGIHWWGSEQYGDAAHVAVFRNAAACSGNHIITDYPPCLNDIDMRDVSTRAAVILHTA